MRDKAHEAAAKFYTGFWGALTKWFLVPRDPPKLPAGPKEDAVSFQPADGYLRYRKFSFWIVLTIVDIAILAGWIVVLLTLPLLAVILIPIALIVAVVPDIVAYLAIHLRYDTTWYVMTQRSIRIRRGIWIISEMTFTFENVQNLKVIQGPLQRLFGISDIIIETAGGGGSEEQQKGQSMFSAHRGVIEGIANPDEIRDQILARIRTSRSSGLGDDQHSVPARAAWKQEHVNTLTEIRDLLKVYCSKD